MKELSIEEKAKRYDDVLKQIKECTPDENGFVTIYPNEIFPELKESEDEKMRKSIIYALRNGGFYDNDKTDEAIAWLEKQGEQKSVDKVEPKFRVGNWVVFKNKHQSIYQVEKIADGYYILRHTHGGTFRVCVLHDEDLRLWTIQDAKDGDVLANDKSVFVYAKILYSKPYAYCGVDKFGVFKDNCLKYDWSNSVDNIHPVTKEQQDLLFQKMREAGYEWDVENRELTKNCKL